jgi:hypothetical protein
MASSAGPLRFSQRNPCPICGGYDSAPRGKGVRCGGFLSSDGEYAHCARDDGGGQLAEEGGGTFAHRMHGECRCGQTHGDPVIRPSTNGHHASTLTELAIYSYRDAADAEVFQVVRYGTPNGDKTFRQRHAGERGEWVWKCPEPIRVLYRLPELLAADPALPVFIVEGEKDADALAAWGVIATTNPLGAGAGKWLDRYSETLRDRWCILVPDNDGPGRQHMMNVAASLRGKAAQVQILTLPNLPERGDASDWLATNPTTEDLQALIDGAERIWPLPNTEPAEPKGPRPKRLSDLQRQGLPELTYVVADILPEGVTLCAGRPKQGKSFLVLNLAIAVASGAPALGDLKVNPGAVLYLSLEGGDHGLLPRVNTMLRGAMAPDDLEYETKWPRLDKGGAEAIGEWLQQRPNARLVIVDTMQRIRPPTNGKQSVYEQDDAALQPLIDLAKRARIAILVVHHTRKSAADDVLDTVSGSTGLTGSVDAVWVLQRVRGQDTAVLTVAGRNIADLDLGLKWDNEYLTWTHDGTGEDARRSMERRLILEAMERDGGGPLTVQEVADLIDATDERAVRKMLWRMERSGELRKGSRGYVVPL